MGPTDDNGSTATDRIEGFRAFRYVMAGEGSKPTFIGTRGKCRLCGTDELWRFRREAHTVPEALGNKWIYSVDECDDCNNRTSRYESALAASIGAILTIGGVRGKKNQTRQTGRSRGPAYIRHARVGGRRALRAWVKNNDSDIEMTSDEITGVLSATLPIANEMFRPLDAHKALLKIGYALLPETELAQYAGLRRSLLDPIASVGERPQTVGLSFAMVGNSPPVVSAALLRANLDGLPSTLVVVTAGSVCLISQLNSDVDRPSSIPLSKIKIRWRTELRAPGEVVAFAYSAPVYFDWTDTDTQTQPIEAVRFEFNPRTTRGMFVPIIRDSHMLLTRAPDPGHCVIPSM